MKWLLVVWVIGVITLAWQAYDSSSPYVDAIIEGMFNSKHRSAGIVGPDGKEIVR